MAGYATCLSSSTVRKKEEFYKPQLKSDTGIGGPVRLQVEVWPPRSIDDRRYTV